MAKGDVLDRERFDAVVGMLQTQKDPGTIRSIRNDLLAHDAALRARIEELEAALEDLCSLSPDCGHYTVPPKHWVRARRALNDTEEGGDGSL